MNEYVSLIDGDKADFDQLIATDALCFGHFKLASERHSPVYFQCARLFVDVAIGSSLAKKLAERVRAEVDGPIDLCVAPAIGGIIVGHEVARQLGCKSLFFERKNGVFTLRRGFEIPIATRVLVVEDVVTTGGSLNTCIRLARDYGAEVVGACSLVQRMGSDAKIDAPYTRLLSIGAPSYAADEVPASLAAVPITAPGSSARVEA